jgi:hypothetical protein
MLNVIHYFYYQEGPSGEFFSQGVMPRHTKERLMLTKFKIIYSMFYAIVLVGISLVMMRICWGVWLSVSDMETFIDLPLNQSPELATIIALGIVSYVLVIVRYTHYFIGRIEEQNIYKK